MADPAALLTLMTAGTAGLSIASAAALRGWNGWLELKRLEVGRHGRKAARPPASAARIEMADLKERVRKLEAIASGIDY